MSYARFGEGSDVYVFLSAAGAFVCCGCSLCESVSVDFDHTAALIEHLERHREAGDKVPQSCVDGLLAEQAENDAWLAAGAPGSDFAP